MSELEIKAADLIHQILTVVAKGDFNTKRSIRLRLVASWHQAKALDEFETNYFDLYLPKDDKGLIYSKAKYINGNNSVGVSSLGHILKRIHVMPDKWTLKYFIVDLSNIEEWQYEQKTFLFSRIVNCTRRRITFMEPTYQEDRERRTEIHRIISRPLYYTRAPSSRVHKHTYYPYRSRHVTRPVTHPNGYSPSSPRSEEPISYPITPPWNNPSHTPPMDMSPPHSQQDYDITVLYREQRPLYENDYGCEWCEPSYESRTP